MSSKIVWRGGPGSGEPLDVHPIQWRGEAAQPQRRKEDRTPADTGREKEALAAAYQQGVAAGEVAAAQGAQARLEPALAAFQKMATELAGMRKHLRAEAESAAVALALTVARRVLHREVTSDPDAILGLVKAALEKCDARETQRLRVSPQDAVAIHEHKTRLNLPPAMEIVADGNLARGSAIFETSRGDLDASVDTQLAEIERGFADVLKRRNS